MSEWVGGWVGECEGGGQGGGREGGRGGRGADTELKTKTPHVNVGNDSMIFWASLFLDKPITGKHMADRVNNRGGTSRMELPI